MTKDYSPSVIASSFISKYYEIMVKNTLNLHKFYLDKSSFTHCDGSGEEETLGMEKIKEKIQSMQTVFANSRVDISEGSIDAQTSTNNNIVLVVTGLFFASEGATNGRMFFQTFVLENHTHTSDNQRSSYFVKNSIFRFISPLGSTDRGVKEYANAAVSTLSTSPLENILPSATNDNIPQPIQPPPNAKKANSAKVISTSAKGATTSDSGASSDSGVPSNTSSTQDSVTAKEEGIAASNSSRSYLDMLKKDTSNVVTTGKDAKDKQKEKSVSTVPVALTVASTSVNSSDTKSVDNIETATGSINPILSSEKRNRQQRNSVYINYIPADVTRDAITKLFSKFGPVSYCDYVTNRGFAFVEYNNAETVQEVIESITAEPFVLSGVTLKVERRNGKGNGTNKEINAKIAAAAEAAQKSTSNGKIPSNGSILGDTKKTASTSKDSSKLPKDKLSIEKKDNAAANKNKSDNPIKSNNESVNKSGTKTHSENK